MQINLPEPLAPLFEPYRYKVLYGGRGGGKSEGIARALLILGMQRPLRILCARELQVSIKESVHHLLKALVYEYNLDPFYEVQATSIKGINGTEFIFKGLKHNIQEIKSLNDVDICWIEEAANVSKASWDVLIPTIRKESSEIWVSYNPDLEDDETHQRFVINTPPEAWVMKLNWSQNPWFPEVLRKEMDYLKAKDYKTYLNVWEGHCKEAVEGAVFADELREAIDRITDVPLVSGKPVNLIWDLGDADGCAVWYQQQAGLQHRFIDYHYECHKKIAWHIQTIQDRKYQIGTIWLPHDADYEVLGAEKCIRTQIEDAFPHAEVTIIEEAGKPHSVKTGIDLARNIFSQCWFDKAKTKDGLQALRHWHYKKYEQDGKTSLKPVHDWSSHGSMAFVYFAMAVEEVSAPRKKPKLTANSWMG